MLFFTATARMLWSRAASQLIPALAVSVHVALLVGILRHAPMTTECCRRRGPKTPRFTHKASVRRTIVPGALPRSAYFCFRCRIYRHSHSWHFMQNLQTALVGSLGVFGLLSSGHCSAMTMAATKPRLITDSACLWVCEDQARKEYAAMTDTDADGRLPFCCGASHPSRWSG